MGSNCAERFVRISGQNEISTLINVLRERLPRAAHVFNMLLCSQWFPEVEVYTVDGTLDSGSIVVLILRRKDFGQDINISAPLDLAHTDNFRHALIHTEFIDWDGAYCFTNVDRHISRVIFEVSTLVKKNSTVVNPNYQFAFSNQDMGNALKFNTCADLRQLNAETGTTFLVDNWKYSKNGTKEYVESVLQKNPSAGVYVDGKLTCGILVNVHGLLGLLYTDPKFRRQGFAEMCVQFLSKEMAKLDMVPCSSAQVENEKSVKFHLKLGMKITNETDYIFHVPFTESRF